MRDLKVKVHPSKSNLKKEDQLANWSSFFRFDFDGWTFTFKSLI